ncbi:MAG TPA: DinB family protein [Pyrinomonadaceae bacterium]|nr:DinB family protein [Pyrinomonadaceae bacterium]
MKRPETGEFASYYSLYIDRITSDNVVAVLESQLTEMTTLLQSISEEQSLYRYAPDKWSIRQLLNHVNDTERVFLFRALWFARGFPDELPTYDQDVAAATANADEYSWASHIQDFRAVRESTLTFFRNLPEDGWSRSGIAGGNRVTVRALAYILAGHVSHHIAVLQEKYAAKVA